MKKLTSLALCSLLASATLAATTVYAAPVSEVVQSDIRSASNKARDEFRNPQQTLNFFGIEDTMTVVEIWPGGGWYSEILAPMLADKGVFYAAHFPSGTDVEYFNKNLPKYQAKLANTKGMEKTKLTGFHPKYTTELAPAGSADAVLTFRNLHNFYMNGDDALKTTLAAAFTALKPGGIFGVVDHRLPENLDAEQYRPSGYVKQSIVISMAKAAGFELVAESAVNANPLDNAQHEKGVWTLAPTFALGDKDRAKYATLGESDRMTLKFIKPNKM